MMRFFIFSLLILATTQSYGVNISLGRFTQNMNSQDKSGDKIKSSDDLFISVGHNWSFWGKHFFSPQLGYVRHESTDDNYGKAEKTTIFLLYDLARPIGRFFLLRYGLGNFITMIKGEGGTVTVPSGGGSATAFRPGDSKKSYNTTLNLGGELYGRVHFWKFKAVALRMELHLFSFLNSDQRELGHTIFLSSYFD